MKEQRLPNMDEAKLMQLVVTNILRRGKGEESDPIRLVTQIFLLDGTLVAEVDSWNESIQQD